MVEPEDLLKIVLAIVAGGLVGAEREFRDKAAGFRTIIFICLGATLFTMFSRKLGGEDDPVRIASNVVTGIGFLGAGAILREGLRVRGLTTAATIWLAAALGMGIAGGYYLLAGATVVVALAVLWVFPRVEAWIDRWSETRTYEVTCRASLDKLRELERVFEDAGLEARRERQIKKGDRLTCLWDAKGRPEAHGEMLRRLFKDPAVEEFRF